MVASLTVIAESETKIEFTPKEVAALDMPGISLGNLVTFRHKMENFSKLNHFPLNTKMDLSIEYLR